MSLTDHAEELEVFRELNGGRRMPWSGRREVIDRIFPSVERLDWKKAFDGDIELLGRLLRDILKLDSAIPGKPGPRVVMDFPEGIARLRQLMGEDFSVLAFAQAFDALAAPRSLRHLEYRTGIGRNRLNKLLRGHTPTGPEMEQIAQAFGKHPSYFVEWRAGYVLAAIQRKLAEAPESTVGFYRRIAGASA